MAAVAPHGDADDKPHLPPHLASRSYTVKKSVAEGCLDLALLMANACQLKSTLEVPADLRTWTFWPLVILIGLSVLLQVITGFILFLVATSEAEEKSEEEEKKLKTLNNVSVGLVGVVTFLNIFISGFGISFTEALSA